MTGPPPRADRGVPEMRVLFGTERFSSQHSWSELTALMPAALPATVDVQWCPPGAFAERARNELIDVVVPLWAELDAETIQAGRFGLIQQFGAGVENIAIAAATSAGVWVANMPGLNAVDVAEHAVLLLLALLRRLPDSTSGFDPGHWGDPPGEALAGSTVCIVGLGAVGSQLARRLDAFEVRLLGVRRDVRRGAPPTAPDIEIVGADRLHEALMAADAVILTASHERGLAATDRPRRAGGDAPRRATRERSSRRADRRGRAPRGAGPGTPRRRRTRRVHARALPGFRAARPPPEGHRHGAQCRPHDVATSAAPRERSARYWQRSSTGAGLPTRSTRPPSDSVLDKWRRFDGRDDHQCELVLKQGARCPTTAEAGATQHRDRWAVDNASIAKLQCVSAISASLVDMSMTSVTRPGSRSHPAFPSPACT